MTKQQELYLSCIEFWKRMGVEQEDNLIALSSYDMVYAYKDSADEAYRNPYYIGKAKQILEELRDKKYDTNRGRPEWLKGLGY